MITISPFRFEHNNIIIEPELLAYKVFKDVYNLDTNTKKELALQYFIYIYHSSDQKTVPVIKGFSTKDTHSYACKEAGLQTTFTPSIEILTAIEFYKENFISPVKHLAISLLNTLQKNIRILKKADTIIEQKLNQDNITPENIESLILLSKSISTMASQLAGQIKTLKDLDRAIEEDKDYKGIEIRGGGGIPDSMTRNNDIE